MLRISRNAAFLASFAILSTCLSTSNLSAGIVQTSRSSRSFFDVFSGVGSQNNRRRETPPIENGPTAPFGYNFTHSGFENFSNESISGTASASGVYDHQVGIVSTSQLLDVSFVSDIEGEAMSEGDGAAFSDMSAELTLEFTIDVATAYSFDLTIGGQSGNAESRFILRYVNTATNLHEFNTTGVYSLTGILAPGNYRLLANSGGSDFDDQPSIATDSSFRLLVGTSVPEPTSSVLLVGLGCLFCTRRTRK